MRLSVLAQGLRVAGGVSVGHNMIAALARVKPGWHYQLFVPADCGYEQIASTVPRAELVWWRHSGPVRRWWFDAVTVPRLVRAFRPDAVFALQGRGLPRPPCPQAAFPQMPHLFYPRQHWGREPLDQRIAIRLRRQDLKRRLRPTRLILCQTEVVEQRIRSALGYRGEAYVCGGAVAPFLQSSADEPVPPALEALSARYRLFYLTKYYAHKNLEILLDLFRHHAEELRDVVVVTTVAADHHPNAGRFLASIERLGLSDRIVNVGPIAPQHVPAYYRHSQALLMPTLIETLGLPYLEAMHFGLPILTSDLDFAHAVCGDAAVYFDPWDTSSIRDAIARLKRDDGLRARLVQNGSRRLADAFCSWDEIAQNTAERLERLARAR